MTRTYLRKRIEYTTFRKLKPGDRFRFDPQNTGPFVKFNRTTYEDGAAGDNKTQTWVNAPVRRCPTVGVEPN